MMNKMGYESIDVVMERGVHPLNPEEFEAVANAEGALVLDVREKEDFVKGFIPNSIFIGLDGTFGPWVGALVPDIQQKILIVAPTGKEEETIKRLARVGYDNSLGYLKGGFEAWKKAEKEVDEIDTINVETFSKRYAEGEAKDVFDVRRISEWESGHIDSACHLPLDFISKNMDKVDQDTEYYVHCRSGYRSTIAASILKSRGIENLVNVHGDFEDIAESGIPTTGGVCAGS